LNLSVHPDISTYLCILIFQLICAFWYINLSVHFDISTYLCILIFLVHETSALSISFCEILKYVFCTCISLFFKVTTCQVHNYVSHSYSIFWSVRFLFMLGVNDKIQRNNRIPVQTGSWNNTAYHLTVCNLCPKS
jgi:hypothetical protein